MTAEQNRLTILAFVAEYFHSDQPGHPGSFAECPDETCALARRALDTFVPPKPVFERTRRQSYLAYLFLNVVECPACHLPKADGLICPCGVDG